MRSASGTSGCAKRRAPGRPRVMIGSRLFTLCGTSETPLPRSAASPAASCARRRTRCGRARGVRLEEPQHESASSVLPDPDAPTTATISPACTEMCRALTTYLEALAARKNAAVRRRMREPHRGPEVRRTCRRWWPCSGGTRARAGGGGAPVVGVFGGPRALRTACRPRVRLGRHPQPAAGPPRLVARAGVRGRLCVSTHPRLLFLRAAGSMRRRRLEPATSNKSTMAMSARPGNTASHHMPADR